MLRDCHGFLLASGHDEWDAELGWRRGAVEVLEGGSIALLAIVDSLRRTSRGGGGDGDENGYGTDYQ